ncbi:MULTISPECIES: thioesterase II family protein [Streptomyces]|uniref:thioesterase II family protein n=1 Tax=Streptomyces TaxID=1883 RepID=UPI00068C1D0A|nr:MULTISPECIES: alpha/beta fold hydrolase [Streptomyces]
MTWIEGADRPGAVRLICLPHAGGGARFYRPWLDAFGSGVALCPVLLPGREGRWNEPAARSTAELVEPLVQALKALNALDGRPFALFGHSMGAGVAYALALRCLAEPGLPGPVRLFVSGRPAPHLRPRLPSVHALPEEDFIARLRLLNGTPPEVLAERGLLEAFLPTLRADFALNETFRPVGAPVLDVPVTAFGGESDPLVHPDELLAWRAVTTGGFDLQMFEGDHFYLKEPPAGLVAAVTGAVAEAAAEAVMVQPGRV